VIADSNQELRDASIFLVKLGTHPDAAGIAAAIRELIPRTRVVGIQSDSTTIEDIGEALIHENMVTAVDDQEWWKEHLFVSPDLYQKVRVYEGQWLRMLERIPSGNPKNGFLEPLRGLTVNDLIDRRFKVILRSIAIWDRILTVNSVKAVVIQNIPHNFWDAVLYRVAQARGLPVLIFQINTRPFLDAIYLYRDVDEMGNLEFGRELLESASSRFGLIPDSTTRVERMTKSVLIGPLDKVGDTRNSMASNRISGFLNRLSKKQLSPKRLRTYVTRRRIERSRNREFESCISIGPIPDRFFMIELQRSGNATSLVKGSAYADPYQLIAYVASSLPNGFKLLVRESSRSKVERRRRPKDFWVQLASIPKVYIASPNTKMEYLLANTTGVIELGYSTLAMRALSLDVAVVILGLTHLRNVPKVHVIANPSELSDVLGQIAFRRVDQPRDTEVLSDLLKDWIDRTARSTIEGNLTTRNVFGVPDDEYRERLVNNTARVIATWYLKYVRRDEV